MAKSGARKVIVTCAVTGRCMCRRSRRILPGHARVVAESAIGAAEAGAAIVHLHARNPETGKPTPEPDQYLAFIPEIKERCNAIINITTGGGQGMTLEERTAAAKRLPEMCSLNMGSMNFARYQMAARIKEYKNEWEAADLEASRDYIFRNTWADIERILKELGEGHGIRFEFECYDVGHLYNLAHFVDRGLIEPPFFVQTIFGILGGIGTDPEDLMHMKRTADRLFGGDYVWSVLGGRHQFNLVRWAPSWAAMSGWDWKTISISARRAGREQCRSGRQDRAHSQRALAPIATAPDEAREMLHTKGVPGASRSRR
ncbi:MAG: 3-keto-5-aminohexanoate cleavage protein [Thermomicrobiales bacterium]